MRARILAVDDDPDMLQMIKDALASEGHVIETAATGEEAVAKAGSGFDMIILDVMLPDRDGYDVCQAVRDAAPCPIVFLSARDREEDRVHGLIVGADDYLVKPFGIRELRARVAAHLRREGRPRRPAGGRALRFGELSIDVLGRTVSASQNTVAFSRREFDIVELLALHPGQVFTKEHIYERIWGLDALGDASTVTEHVKRIRAKLASLDPLHQHIVTLWGVGYKWVAVG